MWEMEIILGDKKLKKEEETGMIVPGRAIPYHQDDCKGYLYMV